MNPRAKKILLLLLAAVLLVGSGQMQKALNRDREQLGLTRMNALENAPPVLAFTTVALGGFRGLIANALWIRANDLQNDDKFFEAAQLASWITDLEPSFTQVWLFQGWNMAYNISVKFKDFPDRWRWVERGIELLRDEGLRYNPDDVLIHRELAWFFQHKMGAEPRRRQRVLQAAMGDGNDAVFRPARNEFFRVDQSDDRRGPDECAGAARKISRWTRCSPKRWTSNTARSTGGCPRRRRSTGARSDLQKAKEHPDKVKADDLITLRRIIYQSMLQAFHHGRIIDDPFAKTSSLEPNLDLVAKVNDAYVTLMSEDEQYSNHISNAHRNFLKDAVYFLYENNRVAEAAKWYQNPRRKISGQTRFWTTTPIPSRAISRWMNTPWRACNRSWATPRRNASPASSKA